MEITIKDDCCWICGKHISIVKSLTDHHTLPKHLKPVKNVVVPVCRRCHDKLNSDDKQGLVSFAYKIQKSFDALSGMVKGMTKNLKRVDLEKSEK